jgi:predicted hydrocarbon binding protein
MEELKERLTREFPEKAPLIMSTIGLSIGSTFAEEMMAKVSDPKAFATYLSEMLAATGWGVFSIVGDTRYGSRLVVSVANCSFCDTGDLAYSPQCHILLAALKGMVETEYGTPHRVFEERCTAMGEPACLFVVESCENPQFRASCNNLKFCEFDLENERLLLVEQTRSRSSR